MTTVDANIFAITGEIYRAIGTGDKLVVALRDFSGADYSAGNPLVHKIGNTPRSVTSFLRVEVLAGTNTFNAGSAELATREIDYFVYLGWRAASSTVFILVSRIPYATTYADFSTTATNEKYGAYSGSAPASSDAVVNIGSFNATLSAGAGYTWSVPATSVVINHPIYETRWLTWAPTMTGWGGSPPASGLYRYQMRMDNINWKISQPNNATSTTTTMIFTLPFTAVTLAGAGWVTPGLGVDNGATTSNPAYGYIASAGATLTYYKDWADAAWTASGNKRMAFSYGMYQI